MTAQKFTAVKPVYNRKTKKYEVEVVEDAMTHAVHFGYFVFEDPRTALQMALDGRVLGGWPTPKFNAVVDYLYNLLNLANPEAK